MPSRKPPVKPEVTAHYGSVKGAIEREKKASGRRALLSKVARVPGSKRPALVRVKAYTGNVKSGKRQLEKEKKNFEIEARGARERARDRRVNRLSKYYSMARNWFSRGGKISAEGYERVSFEHAGKGIIATIGGKRTSIGTEKDNRGLKFVFRATDGSGRLLLVRDWGKRHDDVTGSYRLSISVATKLPEQFSRPIEEPLLESRFYIYPGEITGKGHGIAVFKSFEWKTHLAGIWPYRSAKQLRPGETRAPDYLKGKRFGIFIDSLVRQVCFEEGVTKAFAQVQNLKTSQRFTELGGFRPATNAELKLAEKSPLYLETEEAGKSVFRPFSMAKRERFEKNCTLMVLDLPPKGERNN